MEVKRSYEARGMGIRFDFYSRMVGDGRKGSGNGKCCVLEGQEKRDEG